MRRKIVAIAMCILCLLFVMAEPARAIAGVDDLVVAGATVMTFALVSSLGIMSLSSAGAADALIVAAQNAGQGVREFGLTLFNSYARSKNITAGQAVTLAAQGTSYLSNGKIIFDEAMSGLMSDFVNWAWSDNGGGLINYANPISSGGSVDISSVNKSPLRYPNNTYDINVSSNANFTLYVNASSGTFTYDYEVYDNSSIVYYTWRIFGDNQYSYVPVFISENSFNYSRTTTNPSGNVGSPTSFSSSAVSRNGVTYYVSSPSTVYTLYYSPSPFTSITGTYYGWDLAYLVLNGVIDSEPSYDVNLDVLDGITEAGEVNVLDPDALGQPLDAGTAAQLANGGTVDIQDWLDAIVDLIGSGEAVVDVAIAGSDAITAELEAVADATIPLEVESDMTGNVEIADETSIDGLDDYTLDLADFFPFCIPFDIYDMLSLFAATREAPNFEWRFYVPDICDETIEIDLSPFESAAAVLRTVEKLAFALGLAFVTKKLIQGGD